jgi:hypothetical protein
MSHVGKLALLAAALTLSTLPASAQNYRFDDERGNVAGKRASCNVYARIALVQANANSDYRCGYGGPRWARDPLRHFRWCRYAPRSAIREEQRERARDLADCFDRLGDFDD